MKTAARILGGSRFAEKLKRYPAQLHRTMESVVIQEARALAVKYASFTMPGPGFDEGRAEQFRKRIEGDVNRVFAVRSNPNQIFQMMKVHAPHLANAYWHAHKAKKPRAMAEILRKANLPQGLNPAAHKAARTGKKGRVGKMTNGPAALVNEAQLRVFVRKQRALAGFAKAGWLCAAKGLGGRVRRNIREGDSRRTEEIFPKYIRDLARKYPDAGGARVLVEGSKVTVEIFTNVKHAKEAMSAALQESAESLAQESFSAALAHALRELNLKQFPAKAA